MSLITSKKLECQGTNRQILLQILPLHLESKMIVLGTPNYFISMPQNMQSACKSILGSLNLSQWINRYSKTIRIPYKTYIQRIKSHTFDMNVPKSILINVDNSKVVLDLVNPMIFRPMSPTLIQRIKSHTFDMNVPKSILINVDNSKVILDLVNPMIFCLMSRTLILAHFWQGRKEGEGYGSQSFQMMEYKSYGNPNPQGVFIGFLSGLN